MDNVREAMWAAADESIARLKAAGFGKPGQPNTLWAMTHAACAELDHLRAQTTVTDAMVERACAAWYAHRAAYSHALSGESMRAALEAALVEVAP